MREDAQMKRSTSFVLLISLFGMVNSHATEAPRTSSSVGSQQSIKPELDARIDAALNALDKDAFFKLAPRMDLEMIFRFSNGS